MMPRAPRAAQILIVLFATLAVAYGAAVVHVGQETLSLGYVPTEHTVPGELVVVRMQGPWDWLRSSDESVLEPISVELKPKTTGYFVAMKPGKAELMAVSDPCPATMPPPRCMAPAVLWRVDVEVWPG